jgi:hypothetical protein
MKAQQMKIMMVQQTIVRALIAACIATVVVYAALLASTMFYATETTSFNRQIADATGSLSELEFEYINLKQSVTIAKAKELGFEEVKNPIFVRADTSVAVSLNDRAAR